jgi:hypothetical protein
MKRNDIHCPSQIDPQAYQFVAFEFIPTNTGDLGAIFFLQQQRELIREHMARTGGTYSGHEHGGNCMVCGNVLAIYTVLFYHADSNSYVRMGDICAQKVEMAYDNSAFNRFKDTINGARKAKAGKNKAMVTLMDAGFGAAWDLYEVRDTQYVNFKYEENTICDIVGKLVQYGSISEKQMAFIGRLLDTLKTRDERLAARRAKEDAAAPVPETDERIKIVGTVVFTFYAEDAMFPGPRMIVETVDGWSVTGTNSGAYVKGQKLQFMARVVVSKTNSKKGYFKRPTQVEVLESVAELATA